MAGNIVVPDNQKLLFHVKEVLEGRRRFENAAQSVSRMILEKPIAKITRLGRTVYDYEFFREGKKHIIGWHDEINQLVHFVKDAAEGGSAKEMGIVFISEPGTGKTFFIDYLCARYRQFLSEERNRRYTFKFINLDKVLDYDKKVAELPSLTFEDPMILAMNILENLNESREFLAKVGYEDKNLDALYENRRPLGASTEYLWRKLVERCGDLQKALEHVRVTPVPMTESLGTVTGKYSSKDKITSSSVDLLGEESLQHLLYLPIDDPNKFFLQRGALARVACAGIHFSDEIFKNKTDLIKIYIGTVQDRQILLDGYIWPVDLLIVASSNSEEYNKFMSQKEESPIKDRFKVCYVGHNTDYKLQQELTRYSLGGKSRTTILGDPLHQDPNLIYTSSVAVVLTRLLRNEKLNSVDMMKLEAGEVAGEHSPKTLWEIKETANANPDVTKRWGQKGLGHRDLGRALQNLGEMPESNEGKCLFAKDIFKAFERIILDYVSEATDRDKYMEDLKTARELYKEAVRTCVVNAYRDDPEAIKKDVMDYINMIIGMGNDIKNLGPDRTWRYRDPQTGQQRAIKIDPKYINSVEERMDLKNNEQKESFRNTMRKIYGQKVNTDPNYDFMDQQKLVKAVTDVRAQSEVAGAGSLVGALANMTNDESVKLRNRMLDTMIKKESFCMTCALKTIEYFCEKEDES